MKKILAAKPSITQLEIDYATDAVANGWGENCYDYIERLNRCAKSYFDTSYVWPTSSCHGALHIALMALGIGPGDEVIVPDSTWVGSVYPITWLGAEPVFVDVLENTWCIDPERIEQAITSKTKAIIAVHLYGNLCDMDNIIRVACAHDIPVIEDAAEAIGSEYKGKKAGSIGDFGVFSFHGTKTLTTGEGGMLISNRAELEEIVTAIESQGRRRGAPFFWVDELGLKYKMSNVQAAIGLAQFERAEELVDNKRKIFRWYEHALKGLSDITLNFEDTDCTNSYWMPTIVFGDSWNFDINLLINKLNKEQIATRPFFYPVSSLPIYNQKSKPISNKLKCKGMNLPSNYEMSESDVNYVVNTLINFLNNDKK